MNKYGSVRIKALGFTAIALNISKFLIQVFLKINAVRHSLLSQLFQPVNDTKVFCVSLFLIDIML